jgi:hypothetical protein
MRERRRFAPRFRRWPCLAMPLLMVFSGCGSTPTPPPPNLDEAKQTLERALTSWKNGETAAGVEKASPPIKVSEPKWEGGDKLTKFELQGPGKPRGDQQSFQVMLWLTNAKGKQTKESVEYRVSTKPVETVTRLVFN